MKKKNEIPVTQASDFSEIPDRYEWMPFDSILLDFMPAWHRLLKQQPESLIRFEEIFHTFSNEYQRAAWDNFLFGEIEAFNLLTNNVGRPLFPLSPDIGHFDYIEGGFPIQFEGALLFEDIPDQISEIGDFNYYPRWGEIPPHWTFKLHQHIRDEASTVFSQENTRVLHIGYKRIGTFTTPKKILIYLDKGINNGVTISALCEGCFYRGISMKLLKLTNSFLDSNFGKAVTNRHLLREEIAFYAASLMGELPAIAEIPDEHKPKQQDAQGQLRRLMANLVFRLEDIRSLDTGKSYSLPQGKPDSITKKSNIETTEGDGDPKVAIDSTAPPNSSDEVVARYIFRKREMGGWEIQFANEKIEIPKSRGCIFIHKILECREGYTPYELEDRFDPPKSSIKQPSEDFQEETIPKKATKKSKAEKEAQKKKLKDYNDGIKGLEEEQEEINELLQSYNINPEEAAEKRERLTQIKSLISLAKSEAANIALDRKEQDPEVKKKRQRVDAAIKHARKIITDKNSKIGEHFISNIHKNPMPGAEGFEHRWQYRPATDIVWETK